MANEIEVRVTAEDASENLRKTKKSSDELRESYDKFGEKADEVDTKAMGFRDTMTGVQDTLKGTAMLAKGPSFEGFVTLGAGIGDLGSGMYNFLVPALKSVRTGMLATKVQAAITWVTMLGPIPLIIAGFVALAAGIVLLWRRSETFRNVVRSVWGGVTSFITGSVHIIVGLFTRIPGAVGNAFSSVGHIVTAPFRAAISGVKSLWNSTLGGRGLSIPSWVPLIGGRGFTFPYLQRGGIAGGFSVVGEAGPELVRLPQGSQVKTNADTRSILQGNGGGGEPVIIQIELDGEVLATALFDPLKKKIRKVAGKGNGSVQLALGT